MKGFFGRLGAYLLARSQERSSVAAVLAAGAMILGVSLPAGVAEAVAGVVVTIAGLIAATPGGK